MAQVNVYGSQKYAVRVQADPDKLASRGIGIEDVRTAIMPATPICPRALSTAATRPTPSKPRDSSSAAQFRPLIVTYRNGRPVRLDQVANVIDSVENARTASWFNGERSIVLAIQRQPGTNTVEIVDGIRKLLPLLQEQMPAGMNVGVLLTDAPSRSVNPSTTSR